MNYFQLFIRSLGIFGRNKLIWLFGILISSSTLFGVINPYTPSELTLMISCVVMVASIFSIYLTMVGEGGLIYLIHQEITERKVTFKDAWLAGNSKLKQIVGLYLFLIPVFLIGVIAWYISNKLPESVVVFIIHELSLYFVGSIIILGLCNLIIQNLKPRLAAWTGFLIALNNIGGILLISGIFFVIRILYLSICVLILQFTSSNVEFPFSLVLNMQTYLSVLQVPAIGIANQILNWFTMPVMSIMLTIAYSNYIKGIEYPGLAEQ